MPARTETSLARPGTFRDPWATLRQMTTDLDRMWTTPFLAPLRVLAPQEPVEWSPTIDVFEKDKRLVTRVDLPGMKKQDVKVEVTDGNLTISGERKREFEEKKEHMFRCEREYGSFFRTVPLPEGARFEDVKATFADGVLEVSIPLPVQHKAAPKAVEIH
ncbi:MAG: Hsp20/alpha crystallin family protein [Vicinamibacteria bacterium]|nr:Hsp20/alpha crystallin family protein [Vicinamibacteria bacterium]